MEFRSRFPHSPKSKVLGLWALDLGLWVMDFTFSVLSVGLWVLDLRFWTLYFALETFGFWIVYLGFWTVGLGLSMPARRDSRQCFAPQGTNQPALLDLGLACTWFLGLDGDMTQLHSSAPL